MGELIISGLVLFACNLGVLYLTRCLTFRMRITLSGLSIHSEENSRITTRAVPKVTLWRMNVVMLAMNSSRNMFVHICSRWCGWF